MALRLSDALGTSPELWFGMQAQYDLWRAAQRHHKRTTTLFAGTGRPRPGKSLPPAGRKMRARAGGRTWTGPRKILPSSPLVLFSPRRRIGGRDLGAAAPH